MATATGLVLSVAQTLFAALQCKELRDLCSHFGYKPQLEDLQLTVNTIKLIFLDAESKHQKLTPEGREWVERLKNAVYDADDLFDKFTTKALQQNSMPHGKIVKKVGNFFSRDNHVLFAFNTLGVIKKLRKKLDSIANDRQQFGISDVYTPVKRENSYLEVDENSIIGREADKMAIIEQLLSNKIEENVSFVSIVGIGGLGKTALAKVVYNNDRIKSAFELRLWVCVSEEFVLTEVLWTILGYNEPNLVVLEERVQKIIQGQRYLLVLDDVWSEKREEWVSLSRFLGLGAKGSRILVTTRSMEVANVIGDSLIYKLQSLSDEESWDLFSKMAFKQGEEQHSDLINIGKEIIQKCVNIPLSIRVIGSLLYGQDLCQWLFFKSIDLADMSSDEDSIMQTLMFSYYHLTPNELKSCFSFCSLFPKDYFIQKKTLISLWLAQGYLVPGAKGQSMEDVGEKYFSTLLGRCFFQDIVLGKSGEIVSFKLHDLIHDLARKVAGMECLMLPTSTNHSKQKVRHLSSDDAECFENWLSSSSSVKLRTYISLREYTWETPDNMAAIISNCRRLRVLSLRNSAIRTLPTTLDKLLHLRYLDLFDNDKLEMLPNSITKLHNLQILELGGCKNLKELPEDTSKLVNLRILDIDGCWSLTHMPAGMDNLTSLHKLSMFVVRRDDYASQVKKGKVKDLEALVNLRGDLSIVQYVGSNEMPNAIEAVSILRTADGKSLEIKCDLWNSGKDHETVCESLYPKNHDLSKILIDGYQGTKLPSWASMMATSLLGLVSVVLSSCEWLNELPSSLSQLRHLKYLELATMRNIEYIESDASSLLASGTFFPVLEELKLYEMPRLRGWWRDLSWMDMEGGRGCLIDGNGHTEHILPSFPRLHYLDIDCCPEMTYVPPCPCLKQLILYFVNDALTFCMEGGILVSPATSVSCNLETLKIDNPKVFYSLFKHFVQDAVCINIRYFSEMEICTEGLQRCASSIRDLTVISCEPKFLKKTWHFTNLQSLSIEQCQELSSLVGEIEHLTNLRSLSFRKCRSLDLEDAEEEGKPWKSLRFLTELRFTFLPKLVSLPKGLQYLTSLRSLHMSWCTNLEALPECINSLTNLQSLHIDHSAKLKSFPEAIGSLTSMTSLRILYACKELKDRCQPPCGEDWPKIQHIRIRDIR